MIHIALIRGVNVGGRTLVMTDLRRACETLGLKNPRTLLQSGNLVLEGPDAPAEIEARLEQGLKKRLGMDLEFFVRSPREWDAIIRNNPFPKEAKGAGPGREPGARGGSYGLRLAGAAGVCIWYSAGGVAPRRFLTK